MSAFDQALFGRPSIAGLLFSRSPAAVLRSVVAVVVDAVQRQCRGPLAHVLEKIGECLPSLANADPSFPVVSKFLAIRIEASSLHRSPDAVFRPVASPSRIAVDSGALLSRLHGKATTAASSALAQVASRDNALGAASTPAAPQRIAPVCSGPFNRRQPAEALASQIAEAWHVCFYPKF